jgi:hypothetical protein
MNMDGVQAGNKLIKLWVIADNRAIPRRSFLPDLTTFFHSNELILYAGKNPFVT